MVIPPFARRWTFANLHVATFKPPPVGFDILTASEAELVLHGLPRRPDPVQEADLHRQWLLAYGRPLQHIAPEFHHHPEISHGPGRARGSGVRNELSFTNWSGVVAPAPAGDPFKWVSGAWNVPSPSSPAGRCDGNTYRSSTWIGIDGTFGSNDVLQAGTAQQETCSNGQTQQTIYIWWEWFPAGEVQIANFPVAIGDTISCLICAGSATTATIYLTNQTRNTQTSFAISATGTTALVGNCAEWIMERPGFNGVLSQLPAYNEVDFSNCFAVSTAGTNVAANAGQTAVMQDDFCNVISTGTITGTQSLKCDFTLPAVPLLLAAWKGADNDQGIYFAPFDGAFFLPQRNVPGVGTHVGPALAMFRGVPYMAWRGVDDDQGLYYSSFDGSFWAPQQNIGGTGTSFRPALAEFAGRLYLAWKGIDGDQGIYFSSFDGGGWAGQQNVGGVGTSGEVALASFQGRLYMAWKGVDGDQGIYFSSYDGKQWAGQQKVSGVGTSVGPALAVFQSRLFMAWKGVDGDQGIYFSSFDGSQWAPQQNVAGVGTAVGPALSVLECKLFMAWRGVDGDQGLWYANYDGSNWSPQQNIANVASALGPGLAS